MKRVFLISGVCFAVVTLYIGYLFTSNFWDNRNPFVKQHMWDVTRAWTGVPDLPADARYFKIQTDGDFLTRKFKCSFSAPRAKIEAWVAKVPDLDKAERSDLPDGWQEYVGRGKEGATYFKLGLHPEMTAVRLFVSWN